MNGLRQYPLGHTISGNPHSVCVSLPTVADVFGYEEKEPRVLDALLTGYPRFVEHPLVARLAAFWKRQFKLGEGSLLLSAGKREAEELAEFARGGRVLEFEPNGIAGVWFDTADSALAGRGRSFLQHTGTQVSSREAEVRLVEKGLLNSAFAEDRVLESPEAIVWEILAPVIGGDPKKYFLTRGGMNAFYSAFRAINEISAASGRRRWVQLGWLYVDTICILSEMSAGGAEPIVWYDVNDLDGLEATLRPMAGEIAGIVLEAPTNPLFGMPDLAAMRALADSLGAFLVVDPSLVSIWNARVLPYADVMVASLTKYAAASGDLLAGVLAINPDRPRASELAEIIGWSVTPLAGPDLARLAHEVQRHAGLVERVNGSLREVVCFLESHPRVDRTWWTAKGDPPSWLCGPGAVVSFTLRDGTEDFYDRLEMAKGPSFGTAYSLLSPYVWLAHYGLLKSEEGRGELRRAGVPPNLMRLSVGLEASDRIVGSLRRALD